MNPTVESFIRERMSLAADTYKSEVRVLLAEFRQYAGRDPNEREKHEIILWLACEWISIAAFASARTFADYESVANLMRAEFERGLRKPGEDAAAEAVTQEE